HPLRVRSAELLAQHSHGLELPALVLQLPRLGLEPLRAVGGQHPASPALSGLLSARRRDLLAGARFSTVQKVPGAPLEPALRQRTAAVLWAGHAGIRLAVLDHRTLGAREPLAVPETVEHPLEGRDLMGAAQKARRGGRAHPLSISDVDRGKGLRK